MLYKKVKISFMYAKSRFNRTILVESDINLVKLGSIFCTALGAEFEHNFLFYKGRTSYEPDVFMTEFVWDPKHQLPMKNYTLKDLGEKFKFTYDTGDGWDFECVVSDKEEEIKDGKIAYLLKGKGQGIWEDNIGSLMMYLQGDIDPNCTEENEDEGLYKPWNFYIERFGDFDTAFDLADEQELFSDIVEDDLAIYLNLCHEYGFELEVTMDK